jgi:DNA processing protein
MFHNNIKLKGFVLLVQEIAKPEKDFPASLAAIPGKLSKIYYIGDEFMELCSHPCVAIVGSRKVSPYGRAVTEKLAADLAKQGIVIISGLALGVDSIAHEAALSVGGKTIAVLASGLDKITPSSHTALAHQIVKGGGAIISEYPEGTGALKPFFVARNRIISGLSQAVVITEAAVKSGSLHTANFALEQGREVMAVPGNITSPLSAGTNMLIKTGATPILSAQDVLEGLGLAPIEITQQSLLGNNDQESTILQLIGKGTSDSETLLNLSMLTLPVFSQTLTLLEITGRIKPMGPSNWLLT